jgi:hypothetical protein
VLALKTAVIGTASSNLAGGSLAGAFIDHDCCEKLKLHALNTERIVARSDGCQCKGLGEELV